MLGILIYLCVAIAIDLGELATGNLTRSSTLAVIRAAASATRETVRSCRERIEYERACRELYQTITANDQGRPSALWREAKHFLESNNRTRGRQ